MPSKSANSIHVARMCEALVSLGHDVTLYINRSITSKNDLKKSIEAYYGVHLGGVELISFYSRWWPIALNLRIAMCAGYDYLRYVLEKRCPDLIISRNLYASYFFRIFTHDKLIFETHQLEKGFRKYFQLKVTQCPTVTTVVISEAFRNHLAKYRKYESKKVYVLPDAAPSGINRLLPEQKRAKRAVLLTDINLECHSQVAAYFGHLYSGRGIEIIQGLAERFPDVVFLVYGGYQEQIDLLIKKNQFENLKIMGHIDPSKALKVMGIMDVLLMPYQENVFIGGRKKIDTSRWMSPMKMFEYMATGVPFISSDLPVLREVLRHKKNCLIAKPDDVTDWSNCLKYLLDQPDMAEALGWQAHRDYRKYYTWTRRAEMMLKALKS